MEEFLKIDWHPPIDDMIEDVFINEQRLKEESVMYRIMYGTFADPFTELESDESEEDQEDDAAENGPVTQFKKGWVPGILKLPYHFPRLSSLSKEEQATCLRVMLRFSGSEKPEMNQANRSELDLYMKLGPVIRKEQEEYLNLAKSNWNGMNLKITGKEWLNARWRSKIQNVQKLPRYYVAGSNIPFNSDKKIAVDLEATVCEMGTLPRIIMPPTDERKLLFCDIHKLNLLYPLDIQSSTYSSGRETLYKLPVSQDPNCKRFAETNDVDLVISSGGLNCLAINHGPNYSHSWILPVVVKGSEQGNIVYVDKPLPPVAMTVPQKNAWIYKYILRSHLQHPRHLSSISLSHEEMEVVTDDELFGNPNSNDLLRLEEENDECSRYTVKENSNDLQSLQKSSRKEYSSVTDDANDQDGPPESEPIYKFDQSKTRLALNASVNLHDTTFNKLQSSSVEEINSKIDEPSMQSDFTEDSLSFMDLTLNVNNRKYDEGLKNRNLKSRLNCEPGSAAENTSPVSSLSNHNVSYKIFSLHPTEDTTGDVLKHTIDGYRILVRTHIDGIEKINKDTLNPIILVPKMEHQVALGAETVTAEEALKQWTMLTYRPNTSLTRVRISAASSEIVQVERRTAISINNEIKRLYRLKAEDSLVTLHNVVHDLKTLKPGNYILRHTPSNGAFATIYQESDSPGKNVFDLHAAYAQTTFETILNPPWPPLDKVVVTPAQKFFERMPAMYHPPTIDGVTPFYVRRGRGKRGARGVRGSRGSRSRGKGRGALQGAGSETGSQCATRGGPRGPATRVRTKPAKTKKAAAEAQESMILKN